MLSLHALRVFVTAAECGGIRPAAERLNRTPSAVSMSLKQLEEELGAPLFIGDRKNVLTELGELVLEQAREVLIHFDGASAAMHAFAKRLVGHSRIGAVTSVSVALLPEAIRRMCDTFQGFTVQLRQMDSVRSHQAILEGVVDLAFATWLNPPEEVNFQPLFRDRLDVVCCEGHPLESLPRPLKWEDLAPWRFIHNDSYGTIRTPAFLGIATPSPIVAASVTNLIGMVRENVGISVLPRLCRHGTSGLSFIPVDDPTAFRVVGMLSRRNRPQQRATRNFAAFMREVVRERAERLEYEYIEPGASF
ncbi:LysR family transcriptional regulator [Pseudogemmobacter humi]|uniref:HTH-type transcriptional regulator GltC n=1 Tax=Pseudogemmobacter humi TaxID=2483812 RepID=A0A3P5XWR1_9RHOB|nr:LysR family transcriptional regulator [Pseudogemmobacter humi]VDC33605.1 HTH-type transcriptional regulator GltC [Pseudogemmobacter humi]